MRAHVIRSTVLIIATALALTPPTGAQSGHELFQQALSKERAEGKLQEAIALYQRVVDVASADHALAARALLQLGRCYEQLGNTEARSAYERLIARYPDQTDLVAQAKIRLTALGRTPSSPAPAAMTVQRLLAGVDGDLLAVSPDESKAIVSDYSKGQNLALYDFSRNHTRLLTDLEWNTGGWNYYPVWSPDSRGLAYVYVRSENDPWELRVTTLDGQWRLVHRTERAQPIQPVGWTPDGRTLVVVVSRPDKTWAIGTLPSTGGPFTPLRSLGWSAGSPRVSNDGRFIAYLEGEAGQRDVHVVSLDGRASDRLTDHLGDESELIWSPDGRHLAFMSTRLGGVSLWTIEVKDGKSVGQPVKVKDGLQSASLVDWTARGIFYHQPVAAWDLYTVPMDPIEGRPTGSPRPIPYSRTGRNVSPTWSPDGQSLAFVSGTAAEPNRRYVVVMPAGGGQTREFLIPTASYQRPQAPYDLSWFGDGRGLGFSGTDTRGAPALFRLGLDSGTWDVIPLSAEQETVRTEWNRDGSALYFARTFANPGIFQRAANDDAERAVYRLAAPIYAIRPLELSPDRKWLAFQQWPDAKFRFTTAPILIVDIVTGETRTVLEGVSDETDKSPPTLLGWTPSGDLLVLMRRSETGLEYRLVPVNGGAPRSFVIPAFGPSGPGEIKPDLIAKLSPDGRTMVLVRVSRGGGGAFVIEHPLAGVRAATASR
jgi:Tol biopolymer transport system component